MFPGKNRSGIDAGSMYRPSVYDRIRTREINIFEDTELFLFRPAVFPSRQNTFFTEYQYFSGLHIPDEFSPDRMERTAFGGDYIYAVFCLSITERTESVRVSGTDQLLRRHQHQGIGTVQNTHCTAERFFNRWCV